MAAYCHNYSFWDSSLTWTNNSWPQFTQCFQSTVLELLPCAWLVLISPFYLCYLISCPPRPQPICWILLCKMVCAGILSVVDIIYMVTLLITEEFSADTLAFMIWIATMILYATTLTMENSRNIVRSFPLFIFWLLASIEMLILVYTGAMLKEYENNVGHFSVTLLRYILTNIMFLFTCFAEFHGHKEKNHNPETSASALSWIVFSWLESLMLRGYRRPLKDEDVFELNPEDKSSFVITRFLKNWNRQAAQSSLSEKTWSYKAHFTKSQPIVDEKTKLLRPFSNGHIRLYSSAEEKPTKEDGGVEENPAVARNRGRSSFFKTLVRTFWWEALYSNVGILVYVAMTLVAPYILGWLIDYTRDLSEPAWHGYVYMLALLASRIVQTVFSQAAQYLSNRLAIRVRSTAISAIFRKAMSMSSEARKGSTMGEIVNLMSVDTNHLEVFLNFFYWLWMSISSFFIALYLLYDIIGIAMLAGLAFICVMLCVNVIVTQRMRKYQAEMMKVRDKRLKLMGEVLQGMKVIKLYGWEPLFIRKILSIRNEELKVLFKYAVVDGIDTFAYTASTFWITFFTLFTFVQVDWTHHLDAKKTFLAINFIYLIRQAINFLPIILRHTVKMAISIGRIDKFLQNEDLDPDNVQRNTDDALALRVTGAGFSWEKSGASILKDITLEVKPGQLVAVVGTVGAGKSSLLSALLGEMHRDKGYCNINSSIAYVPQQAWIQNNTVRQNILFGREFDINFYDKVVDACALQPDLAILPAGDLTEIGEKGINLSGGQKQRVALARAVYSQADIYLFDDPLSAVDSHVGKYIFKHVMGPSGLLKDKTRVLVTHGLHWLPEVDFIVVMQDGELSECGTFEALTGRAGAFASFLSLYLQETAPEGTTIDDGSDIDDEKFRSNMLKQLEHLTSEGEASDEPAQPKFKKATEVYDNSVSRALSASYRRRRSRRQARIRSHSSHELDLSTVENTSVVNSDDLPEKSRLTSEEEMADGKVNWSVYYELLKAYGIVYAVVSAFFILGFHTAYNVANVWLTTWNDDHHLANFTELPANSEGRQEWNQYYIKIYTVLGLIQSLCCVIYSAFLQYRHVTVSRVIHAQLLDGIMRAPMSFFDTTPMGRILNRFSQDLDVLDIEIFLQLETNTEHGLFAVGILVIITYTFPLFILFLLPVIVLFYFVQQFYIRTSCQLRRIASNNRSPVFAHFSEMLSGVSVIRAHQHQTRFIVDSETKVDNFQRAMSVSYAANKWMQTRLDIMTYILILGVTLFTIIYREDLQPGLVGLSVTYILMITYELSYVTRVSCELETNVVALERIREYSSVASEAVWNMPDDNQTLRGWPSQGRIEFIDYSTRYRNGLDLVLNSVTFTIEAGEKIGIVGRTGAGKTSMVLSLFRLIEAVTGHILIDGVDISNIGLHALRRNLTILPQDPVLFAGSLRMNLDPFQEKSESELWQALAHAHLKPFVENLAQQLDHDVGEGGENLSMGQRQLVCLARTLLRKTKVLILDEATAAVDMETDELIQRTIRTAFRECTVLTIAHRINTVLDYDRILVLQNGRLMEFDCPTTLLADVTSTFYSMAHNAGLISGNHNPSQTI